MSLPSGLRPLMVCSALLAFTQLAPAQSKVAVINLQRAVLESAEIKAASAVMEAKYKPRANQVEQLQREIAAISQNLQTNAGKLTPQAESDLNAQGTKKQRDLTRLQEDLQADVDRERNEILSKSAGKMTDVVKKIAEEKGFDMVVDVSNTVYFKPAMEITNEVIAAFDKAYPAPAGAAAAPATKK
jgi:outer membrane protein